jgi:hypothetical protein
MACLDPENGGSKVYEKKIAGSWKMEAVFPVQNVGTHQSDYTVPKLLRL